MTFIFAIAAIAGLIWGVLFLARGSLIAGCLAVLILTCCFGTHFMSFNMGITMSLDRLGLVALVGMFIFKWRVGEVEIKPLGRVDYFLLSLVGVLVASTFTHDWRGSSGLGGGDVNIVQHLINGYLIPLTLYFIARQSPLDERAIKMITVTLACFGVYLAFTGIFETLGLWSFVFPRYIADPEIGLHFGRARGPMVQSVSYGVYLSTCLLCLWMWRDQVARHWRLVLLALVPAFLAAVFFSKTRSVWLGAASGIMIVLWFTLPARLRIAVVGSMILAGVLVVAVKKDNILAFNRGLTAADTKKSTSMRGSFAYVSWLMFQDKPIFGFGFGQFAQEKLPYLSDRSTSLHLESIRDYAHHSTFLALLTETGIIGLSLFLAVLIGWIHCGYMLVKSQRAPPWMSKHALIFLAVLGISFWQMLGHEISFTPLDNSLIFFMAGVTVGLRWSPHFVESRIERRSDRPVFSSANPVSA